MTHSVTRTYFIRLIVVISLAVAGWRFLIGPMHTRVNERRATLDAMRDEIDAGSDQIQLQPTSPAEVIAELNHRADALRDLWGVSADASRLYERFDALAHRYGVTIERMEPRSGQNQSSSRADNPDTPQVAEIGYSIELVATYDAVARFLHAVQGETGMVRIESFRVAPEPSRGHEPMVRASVRTVHYQVTGGLTAFADAGGTP
ncbi:MAG: hypothetical protein R3B57_10725 [Phycisphaerales bacterium]